MSDRVIDNPIINSPYGPPTRHFAFDRDGITDRIEEERRLPLIDLALPEPNG